MPFFLVDLYRIRFSEVLFSDLPCLLVARVVYEGNRLQIFYGAETEDGLYRLWMIASVKSK